MPCTRGFRYFVVLGIVLPTVLLLLLGAGLFLLCYPVGVPYRDWLAFQIFSETTTSVGPGGAVVWHVQNDAGATHSGLHYTWVLHQRAPWLPWRVVIGGHAEKRTSDEAITWLDNGTFEIRLARGRWGQEWTRHRVQLAK